MDTKMGTATKDHIPRLERIQLLQLWQQKWVALQRCRMRERVLEEAGLLILPLTRERARVISEALAIISKMRQVEAQELLGRIAAAHDCDVHLSGEPTDGNTNARNQSLDASHEPPAITVTANELLMMLWRLILHIWEAWNIIINPEVVGNLGLPMERRGSVVGKLAEVMDALIAEGRRHEAQAFVIGCIVGNGSSPPVPLPATMKWALQGILQQFSPKHRSVLRQIWEQARPAECSPKRRHRFIRM